MTEGEHRTGGVELADELPAATLAFLWGWLSQEARTSPKMNRLLLGALADAEAAGLRVPPSLYPPAPLPPSRFPPDTRS